MTRNRVGRIIIGMTSRWADFRALARTRDDVGASVVETAIIAAGVAGLALAVMLAIKTLVDGQIPKISA